MTPFALPAPRTARLPVAALVAAALATGCGSSSDDDDPLGAEPGFLLIDPATDAIVDEARTEFVPTGLVFVPTGDDDEGGDDDSDEDNDVSASDGGFYAFASAATPVTRDAGRIERLSLGDTIAPSGTTPATGSDIRVATDGEDVYQIGRFMIDSLTRFDPERLDEPVWQYSVNGEEAAVNPYDVAFLDDGRAYVARYGSPSVWIVDTSAETEANFRIGELDLSAYDTDETPNATDVVVVDGRLFVLLQRLSGFTPDKPGYVAVFDVQTGQEIDTGAGRDGLLGIALDVTNPEGMQYSEATGELLVTGRGNLFGNASVEGDAFEGGVVAIDPETFTADLLVDDGTAEDNDGFVAESLVVSEDTGYVLTYRIVSEGDEEFDSETTLRRFDPRTGLLADGVVAGLEGQDLSVLALGPEGRLWVGTTDVNGAPGR